MLLPLVVGDQTEGMMAVSRDAHDQPFQSEELKLGEIIASDVSLALEKSRLQAQEKKVAAAEERTRIARDLHDAVTQTLYSAGLIAEALPRVWERDVEEGRLGLDKLRRLLHGALSEMRILLFELRPASTEIADLSTLLRHLGNALEGRTRIEIQYEFEEAIPIPQDVKVAFYRIAQEATNNIEKHAKATKVTIEMASELENVRMDISDDGSGFDSESCAEKGYGLTIMRERADEMGVAFDLNSAQGEGTKVSVSWNRQ
jgi:signal transduction histidine kinase